MEVAEEATIDFDTSANMLDSLDCNFPLGEVSKQ
jgi:hypothetical protein